MHVSSRRQPHALVPAYDRGQIDGVAQVLHIHMADAGQERRMMQE